MSMPQLTPVSDASQLGGFDALVLVAPSFTEDSLLPTRLLSSSSSSSGLASTFALARKATPFSHHRHRHRLPSPCAC